MGVIIGIDPGEFSGWAKMQDGRIVDCGLIVVRPGNPMTGLPEATEALVVIERPVYRPQDDKDPNKLITLGIKVGRFKEVYLFLGNTVQEVKPTDWKGSTPKEIQNDRDAKALTLDELKFVRSRLALIAPSYHNNVWDGIGIALWAGRKERRQ